MAEIEKEEICSAYDDVRNDNTPTNWVLLSYDNNKIIFNSKGVEYDELLSKITDDERNFAYVRFTAGDEMSKRFKFVLITWIGCQVTALKKAKVSTDKATVKSVLKSFALEVQTSEHIDLNKDRIMDAIKKAGGANYGMGH